MKNVFSDQLCGGKIISIGRVCDLVTVEIMTLDQKKLFIHIQSFFRIVKNNKVLVCSEDMYRRQEHINVEEFDWDIPGQSIYDEEIKKHMNLFTNSKIVNFSSNQVGDVEIYFDNGLILQILIDTVVSEEKYRIFDEKNEVIICS